MRISVIEPSSVIFSQIVVKMLKKNFPKVPKEAEVVREGIISHSIWQQSLMQDNNPFFNYKLLTH